MSRNGASKAFQWYHVVTDWCKQFCITVEDRCTNSFLMEENKNKIKENESKWQRLIGPIETKDSCSRSQLIGLSLDDNDDDDESKWEVETVGISIIDCVDLFPSVGIDGPYIYFCWAPLKKACPLVGLTLKSDIFVISFFTSLIWIFSHIFLSAFFFLLLLLLFYSMLFVVSKRN